MTNKKELQTTIDNNVLEQLRNSQPVEDRFTRMQIPRLGMFSQDKLEDSVDTETGKKKKDIVNEAGVFFLEKETEELDEDGKKIWTKEEIGKSIDVTIIYNRKQLKMYDAKNNIFTSSPIYDDNNEIITLFANKEKVATGTPDELKKKYEFKGEDGKIKSSLKDNRILYVIYNGELHQLNIGGSSMYSFLEYARKVSPAISAVETTLNSESKVNGSIAWNQMTFKKLRDLSNEEALSALDLVNQIKDAVSAEKAFFSKKEVTSSEVVHPDFAEDDDQLAIDAAKKF